MHEVASREERVRTGLVEQVVDPQVAPGSDAGGHGAVLADAAGQGTGVDPAYPDDVAFAQATGATPRGRCD